jgi:phage major head subunit gpT-like protein
MAITSPSLLTNLNTALQAAFKEGYAGMRAEAFWDQVATLVPSTGASNTYGWLGDFPRIREWVGDRVLKDMKLSGYAISNRLFESTLGVQRVQIEDDQFGHFAPIARSMGQEAAQHPDVLVNDAITAGESTVCYDGQFFFDTDHPVFPNTDGTGTATTWTNFTTGAGARWYLIDDSKVLKPLIFQERTKPEMEMKFDPSTSDTAFTKDLYQWGIRYRCAAGYGFPQLIHCGRTTLTAANFEATRTIMRNLKADGGRPLGVRPTLIMVGASNEAAAKALFEAQFLSGGGSNPNYNAVKVLVNPWMA